MSRIASERSPVRREDVDIVCRTLSETFGSRFTTAAAHREQHAATTTWHKPEPPDGVVWPHSSEEVSQIVRLCAEHRVPVIAFGTGTSLEGHVNAPYGGISVDLSQMNRILAVHAEDFDAVVEPGVTRKTLDAYVRDQGLFFPVDPGADASLGGMAATRASGTNAVRYGTMRDNVIALKAVMANGDIIRTGGRAKKSSAGYDLTRLLIGSEGTLGIITELTLKLHGIPEVIGAGTCSYPSVEAACNVVIATMQSGIPVARIELLDEMMVRAAKAYSRLDLPDTPMLFVEFHGTRASVDENARMFGEISAEWGGGAFEWAADTESRNRLWTARHNAYHAASALRPGARSLATDVCVPISRLAECVTASIEDLKQAGIAAPVVGHVGDGNFHMQPLVDIDDPQEVARCEAFLDRLARRAIAMEGTCTGEHGVGEGKMSYLPDEHGAAALDVMRAIKRSLDPLDILNPGKIVAL